MVDERIPKGPYIVWQDLGCEGWSPISYKTLEEALKQAPIDIHASAYILTKLAQYRIEEDR